MPRIVAVAAGLALFYVASNAAALVYEPNNVEYPPNGMLVPINGNNGEIELNTFFMNQGETIDWQKDAQDSPTSFVPLCGFSADYVLNQAGNHFGIGWYNDTGTTPTASQIHVIVPANSPVGTTITSATITGDPNYAGGAIGFALLGGETHYTNPAYGKECTDSAVCNPSGYWVTALMYASSKVANAYYVAFEDGATSANGWNNDGDFNDDVFFLTGISYNRGIDGCSGTTPTCTNNACTACNGNYGTTSTSACPSMVAPVCEPDGSCDLGPPDAGSDAETSDASGADASSEAATSEAGESDATTADASEVDAGVLDAQASDAQASDATVVEASVPDAAGLPDAATGVDAGTPDSGGGGMGGGADGSAGSSSGKSSGGCGCTTAGGPGGSLEGPLVGVALLACVSGRRRRDRRKTKTLASQPHD